ncbi:MAG: type 4a pilus biogenesis protein PilO [Deltaproteobacteria bacterium]|nr:type 4a pilus biogenesis protein PilO [Deltaproteobacteria bacterium]
MFDRILDLPANQRLLIYSGVAVLIVLMYTFLFYLPRSRELADKQERVHGLEAERGKLQAMLGDRGKAKAEMTEVEGHFNQVKAQLPEQKEIPELLRQVSNLGRDSGLDVLLFRQKPEIFQDLYAEVPVEMSVRGGYHQIAFFFDKVRHLDRIVNVSDTTMKNPRLVGGQMQVDAVFSATTYRFLSEEERTRIAKEKEEAAKKKGRRRSGEEEGQKK